MNTRAQQLQQWTTLLHEDGKLGTPSYLTPLSPALRSVRETVGIYHSMMIYESRYEPTIDDWLISRLGRRREEESTSSQRLRAKTLKLELTTFGR